MMCTAMRPPVNWSRVASWRAATVGAVKPGRWAIMKPRRLVTEAAWATTSWLSGEVEPNATRARSKPPSSWALAMVSTCSQSMAGPS